MADFDAGGLLRRIRRLADVSQRELAAALGVSKSSVAAIETGGHGVDALVLARAAALAGLRLTLLDAEGREVAPMSAERVRDLGGRRFPAHLDTRRSDVGRWIHEPRRDRPETAFTFTRDRRHRDSSRRATGTATDHHPVLPGDSPAARREERRHAAARERARERGRRFLAGEFRALPEPFQCTCPPACDELDDRSGRPVHADDCPCSCDLA
jgi:transcriptional regulator with XRE-family HTH domain